MALIKAEAFIGSAACGATYDRAMQSCTTWVAHFANGDKWKFKADDLESAIREADFWAEFTSREVSSVTQIGK